MRANCWQGKKKMQVEEVADPKILNSQDAIVRITSTAICGSDLHLYNGFVPTMQQGDGTGKVHQCDREVHACPLSPAQAVIVGALWPQRPVRDGSWLWRVCA